MQVVALVIEVLTAPPSAKAAPAIPVPTIARISAYSAAEAPLWSFHRFLKKLMSFTPIAPETISGLLSQQLCGRGLTT